MSTNTNTNSMFMGATLKEWEDAGCSAWTKTLQGWTNQEIQELEKRLKNVPSIKSGFWDTILTYPIDLVRAVLEDPDADELRDPVMKCTIKYRKEINK